MTVVFLDVPTVKSLAAILISSNQGASVFQKQQPLNVTDQGDAFFVRGRPYTDAEKGLSYCSSYVVFQKKDAKIVDFGLAASRTLTTEQTKRWKKMMIDDEFNRIFGPLKAFRVEGDQPSASLDLTQRLYGGLINSIDVAKDYGSTLIGATNVFKSNISLFQAIERAGAWHVTMSSGDASRELVTFERANGRVLSMTP